MAARPGRSPGRIALYCGKLFVGTLDRILGLDAAAVYAEVMRRYPGLLDAKAAQASLGSVQKTSASAARANATAVRNLSLQRQKRIDELEVRLVALKLERMAYKDVAQPAAGLSERARSKAQGGRPEPRRNDRPSADAPAEEVANPLAVARIRRLVTAEAILKAAVSAVWRHDGWISAPLPELLRWAKNSLRNPSPEETAETVSAAEHPDPAPEDDASGLAQPR